MTGRGRRGGGARLGEASPDLPRQLANVRLANVLRVHSRNVPDADARRRQAVPAKFRIRCKQRVARVMDGTKQLEPATQRPRDVARSGGKEHACRHSNRSAKGRTSHPCGTET